MFSIRINAARVRAADVLEVEFGNSHRAYLQALRADVDRGGVEHVIVLPDMAVATASVNALLLAFKARLRRA